MYDNDIPESRNELIEALNANGLPAYELDSGGGTMHVVVPIIDTTLQPPDANVTDPSILKRIDERSDADLLLLIATGSAASNCDNGLFFIDGESPLEDWVHADTIQEAVDEFKRRWEMRNDLTDQMLSRISL